MQLLADREELEVIGTGRRKSCRLNRYIANYQSCDLLDMNRTGELIRTTKPDYIYHLAGLNTIDYPQAITANTLATAHLLESVAQEASTAKVLIIGSAAEFGQVTVKDMPLTEDVPCKPVHPYGVSKQAVTHLARSYYIRKQLKISIARPFNIIGPGVPPSLVVGALTHRIRKAADSKDFTVPIGNLYPKRDFIDVRDVVKGYVSILEGEYEGELFHLCSGKAVAIRDIVDILIDCTGLPIQLWEDPRLVRPSELEIFEGSSEKAKLAFGFRLSYSLRQSVEDAWEYLVQSVAR